MNGCVVVANSGSELEAYLVATPEGLSELFNTVELALSSSIAGKASIQLLSPDGSSFTLHILRQTQES